MATDNQKKRILFVCQYFYPEVFRGNDIAFHWAEEGHEVHVVTGVPNYPDGVFHKGYGVFKKRQETIKGVHVTHLPIVPRGNDSKIMLMLNYFSYFIVACMYVLWKVFADSFKGFLGFKKSFEFDFVFCQQLSPVMMSLPAVLYKKLKKVLLYTWVLDLWPESLSAAGGISNKHILGFFDWFVKKEYKWSDKILTSSKSFDQSIRTYGDYKGKIVYYPQWSDGSPSTPFLPPNYSLPEILSGFKVMFAGAVGEAQGMECNMQATLLTKERKDIKWVIVGDGRRLPWVQQFVKEHGLEETVLTLGRYPSETMFFEKADVMLVSLTDSPLFNLYAPAKISSYMASGRPIIACLNGEGAEVVKAAECGWLVAAGDAEGLAKLVIRLADENKETLNAKGACGLKFYKENFDKEKCLSNLDDIVFSK